MSKEDRKSQQEARPWLVARRCELPCTVEVSHQFEQLGAQVHLPDSVQVGPGDRVEVHGNAIRVPYGQVIVEKRTCTFIQAPRWASAWVKATGDRECLELLDVSFSDHSHQVIHAQREATP